MRMQLGLLLLPATVTADMRQAYCFYLPIRALRVRNDSRRRRGLSRELPGADWIVALSPYRLRSSIIHASAENPASYSHRIIHGMGDFIYRLIFYLNISQEGARYIVAATCLRL